MERARSRHLAFVGVLLPLALASCSIIAKAKEPSPATESGSSSTSSESSGTDLASAESASGSTSSKPAEGDFATAATAKPRTAPAGLFGGKFHTSEGNVVLVDNGDTVVSSEMPQGQSMSCIVSGDALYCHWKDANTKGRATLRFDGEVLRGKYGFDELAMLNNWTFKKGHVTHSSGSGKTTSSSSSSSSGGGVGASCGDNSYCEESLRCMKQGTSTTGTCTKAVGTACKANTDCSKNSFKFSCQNNVCK